MSVAGYIRFYCDFLFSVVAAVYVIRTGAIIVLLSDIVAHAELDMLPLHPDNAGGLEPIGRLGLRNQYAITVSGLNLLLACFVSYRYTVDNAWSGYITAAAITYSIIGPLVFVGPLLPFRESMLNNKTKLMDGLALRMRVHLDDLRSRFQSGTISAEDEQLIERLRKISSVVYDMPVWPFDANTLRKFIAAYSIPFLTSIIPLAAKVFDIPFL